MPLAPGPHLDLLLEALRVEAAGQRALLAGEEATGAEALERAAELYRRSWEAAPPASYGRLVGMLKAAVIAGGGREQAAYARQQIPPGSPAAAYALAVAALVLDDDGAARAAADGMRAGSPAFGRAADGIAAIADHDAGACAAAVRAIVEDFEARDEHLTGVAIADTALMLARLAQRRGLDAALPASPLLPPPGA